MQLELQSAQDWKFYWLSTPTRPTVFKGLALDVRKEFPTEQELESLAMRILETIRRLNREKSSRRIDIRPLTRGETIGLHEIRWEHSFGRKQVLLRLFIVQLSGPGRRIGIRFYVKRVLTELAGTNRLQDLAIDDSIREYLKNQDSNLLEIN